MKIEFWVDYLCPKCYIQHQALEKLIQTYEIHDLEIIYRSYEMFLDETYDHHMTYVDYIAKYNNISTEEAQTFLDQHHVSINLFRIHDVHRLSHLAKKEQCSRRYTQEVFKAIYEDHLDLSKFDVLKQVGIKAGLDPKAIDEVLSSNLYDSQVLSNRENAQLKGIYALPSMRINGTEKLKGIHQAEEIVAIINRSLTKINHTEFCEGENCVRKKRNPA